MGYHWGADFFNVACDLCGLVLGNYSSRDEMFTAILFTDKDKARRVARGRGWHVPVFGDAARKLAENLCIDHIHEDELIHCLHCRTVGLRCIQLAVTTDAGTPWLDLEHNQVSRWAWVQAPNEPPKDVMENSARDGLF